MRETKASAGDTRGIPAVLRTVLLPVVDDAERELRAIEAKHSPEDWLTR